MSSTSWLKALRIICIRAKNQRTNTYRRSLITRAIHELTMCKALSIYQIVAKLSIQSLYDDGLLYRNYSRKVKNLRHRLAVLSIILQLMYDAITKSNFKCRRRRLGVFH